MINKIMIIGYTYVKLRIKNPLDIFYKIAHTVRIIACIVSGLAWTPELQGRYQSIPHTSLPMELSKANNQYIPNTFDTYMQYMLWESGCTHYINPYFELYTQYKPLMKGDDIEVNSIGGIINPKGIVAAILYLEDNTGKL